MESVLVPVTIGVSAPVTILFMGATFYHNVARRCLNPLHYRWYLNINEKWHELSEELCRHLNDAADQVSDGGEYVQTISLTGTSEQKAPWNKAGREKWIVDYSCERPTVLVAHGGKAELRRYRRASS
eukprot:TRINITY_DN12022_c0_g1_i1.p2 TRINITY_DN12022_c0_g1~~TRINITY_DN12022_c0_g1_i1.p2  ORF type:complete len:127 (+),score=29.52 TRINITY_DN12022_c0_g1_i1:98-478(+)